MVFRALVVAILLILGVNVPASAQTSQSRVTNNLNMRTGPGTQFPVITQIPAGTWVRVFGCTQPVSWCRVGFYGTQGWVSANYLSPRPGIVIPMPPPGPGPFPPPPPGPFPPGPFPPGPGPFPFPLPWPGPSPFPPGPGPGPFPGEIVMTGTMTGQGAECPVMRGDDGRLYSLAGNTGPFGPGDRVRVRGEIAQMSFCMQGTTISVRSIRPAF